MADKRKLQGEIERCMKKVTEGVETFEDIWQKVHNATSANQKEKYEADLKKEIKKLQRLRDQIKTWLTSNDIKDKRELMEKRKLIETQMERFKVIERETKMKAYSKEGLGLATKIDPAQKEKEEVRQWLMDCLNDLQMQIDQFEYEIESIRVGTKKKKLDRDRQDRVDELADWVERHRFHIKKLEGIMRMMDNCSMETEEVKSIQDDLNYYVESNQEPDFAENELIYEDLSLDDVPNVPGAAHFPEDEVTSPVAAHSPIASGPLSPKTPTSIKSTSQELFEERRRGKTSVSSDGGGSEIVPQSPRRPGPKSLLQNSSNPSRQPSTPILKTPTPTVASAKPLKAASLPLQSSAQKPSGNNGASTPSTVQPPHAYAVAAGGNQTPHPTTMPLTSQPPSLLGSQPESEGVPSLPHPSVTLPHQVRGSLESSGSYSQQHSRSSSSSSSLSPSFTPSSTQDTQAPSLSLASAITSVTSSSVVIATSTGASTSVAHDSNSTPSSVQSAMSPSLSSFSVSVNSSPGESPATQTAPSLSPIHVAQLGPASLPISSTSGGQLTSSQSGSSLSGRALTRTDSSGSGNGGIGSGNGGIGVTPSSISAPSLFSPSLNQPPVGLGGFGIGDPQQPSIASSGSSSAGLQGMTSSISSSFNFPVRSSSSFSPTSTIASAISAAMSGSPHTNPGSPFDNFRFPVTAPSPPVSDSIVVAQGLSSLKSIAAEVVASHDLLEEDKSEDQEQVIRRPLAATLDPSVAAPGSRLESMLSGGFGGTGGRSNRVDPQLQPLLGVAPLGPIPLSSDRVVQLRMLESSYKHLPQLSDSERVRPYLQRNPYPTAHHHHQHPPPLMDSFEFYQRLSIESLFFMFYYMEGTKAQYMAAKALKKLSWRFHTKYMTWFQRLEEPKAITDEYEMGTYIYFDYEKWAQRKKDGFTFEYRFLEDRELP